MRVSVDCYGNVLDVAGETQISFVSVTGIPVYGETTVEIPVCGDDWRGNIGAVVDDHTRVTRIAGLSEVEREGEADVWFW